MTSFDGRNEKEKCKTYYIGGKPYYGIPPKEYKVSPKASVKPSVKSQSDSKTPTSKHVKLQYNNSKILYDASYISYVANGESAAVFITRDIAKNVPTVGKWIDVILSDGHKNKHDRWDFKQYTVEIFPRYKTPVYPKNASDEDKKYITWKTAHEDIEEQRRKV